MGRYIKYEIKGSYKFILGVLALVLILTTGIYTYVNKTDGGSAFGGAFIGISSMVIFGTLLTTFIYIVGSFRKELYEDRGYLTFTLPLTGNEILGAKLIVAIIWFVLLGIVIIGYNIVMAITMTPAEISWGFIKTYILPNINNGIKAAMLFTFISGISTLILIYFSMALSRVTFRNKKIGGFWFVIFLVLSVLIGIGQVKLIEALPYYLNLDTFRVTSYDSFLRDYSFYNSPNLKIDMNFNNEGLLINNGDTYILNLAGFIYSIAIGVMTFLGTGYIVENKIDL